MTLNINGEGVALQTGDVIAYGDAVGWTVVWNRRHTFNVWHNLELVEAFDAECAFNDETTAHELALGWIMSNTPE